MIKLSEPSIGEAERAAVLAVLASGRLAGGPVVAELEAAFAREAAGTRAAVAVASGTAALHVALLAHGIGAGDEVITTPFTFQATANMVVATGARPVFVDVGEDGNIDAGGIETAITPRTRAILPVHLYGRLADVDAIGAIAGRRGLVLIEDAAQAHGAARDGRRAGSFGTGCFSFYATKNMTAGEGGMITTDDDALAGRMRRIRQHGQDGPYSSAELGFNYRLSEVQAALALVQLRRLPAFNEGRRRNAALLSAGLRGVGLPPAPDETAAMVWHQYTVRVAEGRDALCRWLGERGIEAAIYYPALIPSQPLYRDLGHAATGLPVAARLAEEVLSLPVHPGLGEAEIGQVVAAVNEWAAAGDRGAFEPAASGP